MSPEANLTISPKTGFAYVLFLIGFGVFTYFTGRRDGADAERSRAAVEAMSRAKFEFDAATARPDR